MIFKLIAYSFSAIRYCGVTSGGPPTEKRHGRRSQQQHRGRLGNERNSHPGKGLSRKTIPKVNDAEMNLLAS